SRPAHNAREARRSTLAPAASAPLRDQLSAVLRDELLAEVAKLCDGEGAAQWARRALPAKNSLTDAHARLLEEALQAKPAGFAAAAEASEPNAGGAEPVAADPAGASSPAPGLNDTATVREAPIGASASADSREEVHRKRQSRKRGRPREPDASR